jgi:hypothetical protein
MNQALVNFYCKGGRDAAGRTFNDIMGFSDKQLEEVHDYVQWLFPTVSVSSCNADAPILDEATINYLKKSPQFNLRFHAALQKMFRFWGFVHTTSFGVDGIDIHPQTSFQPWMTTGNHNFLRFSRLLESSRLLGWPNTSKSFFESLLDMAAKMNYRTVNNKNVFYWYVSAFDTELNKSKI